MDPFDLVVIGAGPAGYVGAIRAAQLGMRVALVERASLGGTCLNIGCIPSKALLDATHELARARERFSARGIRAGEITADIPAMQAFKEKTVKTLVSGIGGLLRKDKIEHIVGNARLKGGGEVEVEADGKTRMIGARHILLATGSAPVSLPALPADGNYILTSTEALSLSAAPRRLLVVGAGAIGLELGSVWNRLGSKVTMVEFLDRIAPASDREVAAALQKSLEKQGLRFKLSTRVTAARVESEQVHVTMTAADDSTAEDTFDRVLVAVGRRPVTDGLGLEQAGIQTDKRGFVLVGDHYATTASGVYAVGDVIGGAMLAHKASEEAVAAVERMAGTAGHVDYTAIPNIIYTAPELASVGKSESDCDGEQISIGKFPFSASGRARCMDETEGFVKVIVDASTDRVLGVHILHARASDLIAEAVLAMEYAASSEDIARTMHAHPTLSEALHEAALAASGRAIHI